METLAKIQLACPSGSESTWEALGRTLLKQMPKRMDILVRSIPSTQPLKEPHLLISLDHLSLTPCSPLRKVTGPLPPVAVDLKDSNLLQRSVEVLRNSQPQPPKRVTVGLLIWAHRFHQMKIPSELVYRHESQLAVSRLN